MGFFFEIFRLGIRNLGLHKLRSTLTSLGIILGVAAVIVVVAVGEGNKISALREVSALGATNIIVRSSKPPEAANAGQARTFFVAYGLLRQDLLRLGSSLPDASAVVPLKAVGSDVSYENQRITSQVFGSTPKLLDVARLHLEPRGRYLSDEDLVARAPVCVVGSEIAKQFFRMRDPIGATIKIDNTVFRVIGVLEPVGLAGGRGSALVGRDLNKDIHIPITTAESQFGDMVMRRQSGSFSGEQIELSELYIVAPNTDSVVPIAERVRRVVDAGHPGLSDVQIVVPWELLENAKRQMMVWNVMLVVVAAISLLVGGIGIMNIMLASVTERTREIGIRRALGATRNHIVLQFLVETGALSALGGVVGILLGLGISWGLQPMVQWLVRLPFLAGAFEGRLTLEPSVTLWSIVVSFMVAAGVGLVFGIYPAIVASRKDPIEALRHD
ncbi:MAG: putative transporter permease YknZ, partial [Planctomycetota bacterium]|jgi:putative ABC transport system permease protein